MKLNQLTFTRFIAAISIVIFHANGSVYPFNLPILSQIFNQANVTVSYFFILSGFVMIIAYGQNKSIKIKAGNYYLNRFARIYPVYFIALALTIFVTFKSSPLSAKSVILQLFAIQSWVPGFVLNLNTPAWSLSVEGLFYLSFPLLFNYFYRKYSFKSILIFILSFWLFTQLAVNWLYLSPFYKGFPSNSHDFLFYFPLMHLNEFMVGNLLGFIFLNLNKAKRNYDTVILGVFFTMLTAIYFNNHLHLNSNDGLMVLFFAPLILLIALNNGKITHILSNKFLVLLGESSYSIYILQYPVSVICYFLLSKTHLHNGALLFYIYLLILISLSIACYYFVEIPAKDWIKNRKNAKSRKIKLDTADDTVNF